jgi:hypothetical protein
MSEIYKATIDGKDYPIHRDFVLGFLQQMAAVTGLENSDGFVDFINPVAGEIVVTTNIPAALIRELIEQAKQNTAPTPKQPSTAVVGEP